jgi:hypothetical protein
MLFLALGLGFEHEPFRQTYFYLMVLAVMSTPVSYATGIVEWKQKYKGARVRVFVIKYRLGLVMMALGFLCALWYWLRPAVLEGGGTAVLFVLLNFSILPVIVYMGYLGGKVAFGGGH